MFFSRLKALCDERNIAISAAVKSVTTSSGLIDNWKKGGRPRIDIVIKLADLLDTSTDFLLERTDDPTPVGENTRRLYSDEALLIDSLRTASPSTRETVLRMAKAALAPVDSAEPPAPLVFSSPKDEIVHQPISRQKAARLLKRVEGSAAAGVPITAVPEDDLHVSVPAKYLAKRYSIIRAQGDSMVGAGINNGDYCVFDTEAYQDEGRIMLVRLEGSTDQREMTIKHVYFHPGDDPDDERAMVELRSENPSYPPMFYHASDAEVTGVLVDILAPGE